MDAALKIEVLCLPDSIGMRINLYQAGFAQKSSDESRGIELIPLSLRIT